MEQLIQIISNVLKDMDLPDYITLVIFIPFVIIYFKEDYFKKINKDNVTKMYYNMYLPLVSIIRTFSTPNQEYKSAIDIINEQCNRDLSLVNTNLLNKLDNFYINDQKKPAITYYQIRKIIINDYRNLRSKLGFYQSNKFQMYLISNDFIDIMPLGVLTASILAIILCIVGFELSSQNEFILHILGSIFLLLGTFFIICLFVLSIILFAYITVSVPLFIYHYFRTKKIIKKSTKKES